MPFQEINDRLDRIEAIQLTEQLARIASMDNNGNIIGIDIAHAEIHSGDSYKVQVGDESVLGDNATLNVAFRTGLKEVHMFVDFDTLVAGWLTITEGVSWTAGTGSSVSIMFRNRIITEISTVKSDPTGAFADGYVSKDVTGISGGTVIDTKYAYGTKQIGTARNRGLNEFVLAINTNYVIVFTATGGSNAGFIRLNWYEK